MENLKRVLAWVVLILLMCAYQGPDDRDEKIIELNQRVMSLERYLHVDCSVGGCRKIP